MPISTSRATTCSICASVARSSITTTMASSSQLNRFVFPVDQPPLEPPRLVDDPLEQPRDRVGAERPFRRDAAHVREHLLLALGLIDLDARAPSSAGRSRTPPARARSAAGPALRPRDRCRRANRQAWALSAARSPQPPHVVLDPRDQIRRSRLPRRSPTPARCRPPPRRHRRRPRRRAPAARCRTRARSAASCARESAATIASAPDATSVARAGDAQPRDPVQKPAARAPPPS